MCNTALATCDLTDFAFLRGSTATHSLNTKRSTDFQPEPTKSPILDVTETTTLTSGTGMDISAASENKSVFSFHGFVNTEADSLAEQHQRRLFLTFPNLSVIPGSGALLNNKSSLPAFEYIAPASHAINTLDVPLMELNRVGNIFPGFMQRRSRGEKRPIPEEQKDEKYYERRKRNNEAAKKSRDARKIREDRIAFRAALLEQENSILRAQVLALRDELQSVRQLLNTAGTNVFGMVRGQVS